MSEKELTFGARYGPLFAWAWLAFWAALLLLRLLGWGGRGEGIGYK